MKPVYVLIVALAGAAVAGAVGESRQEPAAVRQAEAPRTESPARCPVDPGAGLDTAEEDDDTNAMPDDDVHAGLDMQPDDETDTGMPDDVHAGLDLRGRAAGKGEVPRDDVHRGLY